MPHDDPLGFRWRLRHLAHVPIDGPTPAQVAYVLEAADVRAGATVSICPSLPAAWFDRVVAVHARAVGARVVTGMPADVVLSAGGRPPLANVSAGGLAVWLAGDEVLRLRRTADGWKLTRMEVP